MELVEQPMNLACFNSTIFPYSWHRPNHIFPAVKDNAGRMLISAASIPMRAATHENLCCLCRFQRGLKRKPLALIKKLRKAKREAASGEKPEPVRTHLRNMIIVPEMIGSIIGVYNGKTFNQVSPATLLVCSV